jgi:serine phosphatase RsbU (regulator of sigma subunit)
MQVRDKLEGLNDRLSEINQELARQQELIEQERELAAHVHQSLTSGSDTDISNITIWTKPVSGFSGDLILTVRGPDRRVYLLLGDFTGHGLPAALGAVPAAQIFLSMARKGIDIETITSELHTRLSSLLPVGYFCCAALVCVDTLVGNLWVVNAGLPPLLLKRRADDAVIEFASKYTPLGVGDAPAQPGQAAHTMVADGDSLLLYTDGLIELTNPHDEQWGMERLLSLVAEERAGGSSIARLQQECEAFAQDAPADDDISVIEFRAGAPER